MKILAIETATEACSAALAIDDSHLSRFEVVPRQHTQLILPMIDDLLKQANISINQLDAIAFGQGPGAFTGVRIAIGVVQGMAFAHDLPVIPVSTLTALAQSAAKDHDRIAAIIDARMQEIYWGLYEKNDAGIMQVMNEERLSSPENYPMPDNREWYGVGSGWKTYSELLETKFKQNLIGFDGDGLPSADAVLTLAKADYLENKLISVEEATPVYLRNKVAEISN